MTSGSPSSHGRSPLAAPPLGRAGLGPGGGRGREVGRRVAGVARRLGASVNRSESTGGSDRATTSAMLMRSSGSTWRNVRSGVSAWTTRRRGAAQEPLLVRPSRAAHECHGTGASAFELSPMCARLDGTAGGEAEGALGDPASDDVGSVLLAIAGRQGQVPVGHSSRGDASGFLGNGGRSRPAPAEVERPDVGSGVEPRRSRSRPRLPSITSGVLTVGRHAPGAVAPRTCGGTRASGPRESASTSTASLVGRAGFRPAGATGCAGPAISWSSTRTERSWWTRHRPVGLRGQEAWAAIGRWPARARVAVLGVGHHGGTYGVGSALDHQCGQLVEEKGGHHAAAHDVADVQRGVLRIARQSGEVALRRVGQTRVGALSCRSTAMTEGNGLTDRASSQCSGETGGLVRGLERHLPVGPRGAGGRRARRLGGVRRRRRRSL